MFNPVRNLMSDSENKSTPIGTELAEKEKMVNLGRQALNPTSAPVKPVEIGPASSVDKIKHTDAPGTVRGVKKIDTKEMVKPLGQMHKGGTIPKTGPYEMKKDEHVLTPEKHEKLHHALGLAMDALSHGEPDADDVPQEPAKVKKDVTVRKLNDKSFHMKHRHEFPHDMPEHDEEFSAPDMEGLKAHMDQHFGE